jgi:hypothetical protein
MTPGHFSKIPPRPRRKGFHFASLLRSVGMSKKLCPGTSLPVRLDIPIENGKAKCRRCGKLVEVMNDEQDGVKMTVYMKHPAE